MAPELLDLELRHFNFGHLPEDLQKISKQFYFVAKEMFESDLYPDSPAEFMAGIRKLLEAKDCFVRAAVDRRNKDNGAASN